MLDFLEIILSILLVGMKEVWGVSIGTIVRIVETKGRAVQAWWSQKNQRQVV